MQFMFIKRKISIFILGVGDKSMISWNDIMTVPHPALSTEASVSSFLHFPPMYTDNFQESRRVSC